MPGFVLDTSAVLAALKEEPEAPKILDLLRSATNDEPLALPFIVLMETEYKLRRERLSDTQVGSALARIGEWPATVHESNPEWRRRAALVKANNRLSLADAWIAALALLLDAELVHKDPEFDAVAGLRALRL